MPDDEQDGWSEALPWIGQYILDADGNPVRAKGLLSWGLWMQKNNRQIADTHVANVRISTIFMGLDYAYTLARISGQPQTPLLFETMVFGGVHDHLTRRYATREDALEGHRQIVQMHTS